MTTNIKVGSMNKKDESSDKKRYFPNQIDLMLTNIAQNEQAEFTT